MPKITTAELKAMMEDGSDPLLINTSPPDLYGESRIPGSISVPLETDDFTERVMEKSEGHEKVVLYCARPKCSSSTEAAKKLNEAGMSHIYDYSGGAAAWTKSGERLYQSADLPSKG